MGTLEEMQERIDVLERKIVLLEGSTSTARPVPCRCGVTPSVNYVRSMDYKGWRVECPSCDCTTHNSYYTDEMYDKAVAAWNTWREE